MLLRSEVSSRVRAHCWLVVELAFLVPSEEKTSFGVDGTPSMQARWPSAGDAPYEGLLKPKRRGISRVCEGVTGLRPATPSQKHGLYSLYHRNSLHGYLKINQNPLFRVHRDIPVRSETIHEPETDSFSGPAVL